MPFDQLKRREFIALLGSAATAWPLAAHAQQTDRLPTIGYLGTSTPAAVSQWTAALVQRLRELGWIEGRTIAIEYRWADGHPERYPEIAAEFVRLKVDVIFTTVPAVAALKQATSVIPVVFALATDPVGGGLVASLARPGGNVTGMSMQATDLAGKRVELLFEAVPQLKRLAVLGNVDIPQVVLEMREVAAESQKLDLQVVPLEIRRAEDIAPAFEALKGGAEALYVCTDPLSVANKDRINALALAARLPTMHGIRENVEAGGLMSYGASFSDQFRRAADLIDKILHGTKPGDIPVEQPTKFELAINLKTAKELGVSIPQTLLATADVVVE
jgi:putative tryptophan/tyrosine transport system substrate-binding protein